MTAPAQGEPWPWLAALSQRLNGALAWAAGLALAAMMVFTAVDVLLRTLGRPVAGSFEIIGWLSAVAMALALGYVQLHRGHVSMTLVSDRLGSRAAALLELVNGLLALALFATAAFYVMRYGSVLKNTGSLSETLKVAVHPWVYAVGIGMAGLTLALLVDFLRCLARLWRPAA